MRRTVQATKTTSKGYEFQLSNAILNGLIGSRISQHNSNKDFWNLLFGIKLDRIEGFNDTHCGYLEHFFIKKAKDLDWADVSENIQIPVEPEISESLKSECFHYVECIETLLSTLGLKCFQDILKQEKDNSDNSNISSKKLEDEKEVYECSDKRGHYGKGV